MGDVGETYKATKKLIQEDRKNNLASADSDGWSQHNQYHWYRQLNGKKLDYWPSRNKFQYNDRVMTGNVKAFIKKLELKG